MDGINEAVIERELAQSNAAAEPAESETLAASVERRFPQIQSRLISALQFSQGRVADHAEASPVLVQRVVQQAAQQAPAWPVERILNHGRARGHFLTAVAVLGVLFASAARGQQPKSCSQSRTHPQSFQRTAKSAGTRGLVLPQS